MRQVLLLPAVLGLCLTGPGLTAPGSAASATVPAAVPEAWLQDGEDSLRSAQGWLDAGRPGRALKVLDESADPVDAARLQLEWQAASAARDYQRLLQSARAVVDQPVEGLSDPLAAFWAAHAALWLRRTSAASSALLALEDSLEDLDEAERATWLPTVEQYRTQVAEAQATEALTADAVSRAKHTALALLGVTLLALLASLRR